jgi:PBP1b-binding outer membrane lipoprotein LpoB
VANDKFLVQLAQSTGASVNFNAEQLGEQWKNIGKDKMIQFKMKVDIQVVSSSKNGGQSSLSS